MQRGAGFALLAAFGGAAWRDLPAPHACMDRRGATRVRALEDLIAFMKSDVRSEESQKK